MSTVKKKIRIKKKNFTIFIIVLFFLCFSIIKTISFVSLKIKENKERKIEEEKQIVEKREEKITPQPEKTDEEIKLEQLNHIEKQIDYFNNNYIDRYISYKNNNPELDLTQVIKNVNMQLDYDYYENITPAKNLNTEKIIVNKHYSLEDDYVPNNLEEISTRYALSDMKLVDVAKNAFENMASDASKEGYSIIAMSTYRSYKYQVNLYNKYVKQDGADVADTYSGRPGHSEHQTGLAVDVYNGKVNYTNFESTKEFDWMQEHAHEYGFILRFPSDKVNETGYRYESWHYRYVGVEAATYIKENNISFEEYYATKIKEW